MYEVGQRVKVVNTNYDSYGRVGIIVDVDPEWAYPYELDFGEEKFEQELYGDKDIQLVIDTSARNKKPVDELIAELIVRMASESHTRENALTITKLQEARMWFIEGKNIHGA